MSDSQIEIKVLPVNKSARVSQGMPFVEVARALGIPLHLPCGGEGKCGKCRLLVENGAAPPAEADLRHLRSEEIQKGYRLACQLFVTQPLTVTLPPELLATGRHQILTSTGAIRLRKGRPPVEKVFIDESPQNRESLIEFLRARAGVTSAELTGLRDLAAMVTGQQTFTLLTHSGALLGCEPGDTSQRNFGLAFDLGTTTIVASLVDVTAAEEMAVAARLNPQTQFGDDVISRIHFACENAEGLGELQRAIVGTCEELIDELTARTGVRREEIYQVVCAGNTTMQHIFCGFHPFTLGRYPFTPVTRDAVRSEASAVGLRLHPLARLYVFPSIGGFVGGDTVAGILTSGILEGESPALLIDLGTNGEIVVYDGKRLFAAATAAGPAFEGAKISSGMRAMEGAIEQITWDETHGLRYRVIGHGRPIGLCGSALLDLLALLLDHGIVNPQGRLLLPSETTLSAGGVSKKALAERVVNESGRPQFIVAEAAETASGRSITLTQQDIRQLQLAIGAIRAGTEILLARLGLQPADLRAVYLAGGFGNYIRRRNAQRVGLLPASVTPSLIKFCGNTSLLGAKLGLVSQEFRGETETIARQVVHVDLSQDPNFHWKFAEAMIFPEGGQATQK